MFRRSVPLGALVFVSACAAPRAEKLSFAEAFRRPVEVSKRPVLAGESSSLQVALASFAVSAREQRLSVVNGSPMPVTQQDNWDRLIAEVDAFLSRPPAQTVSTDVVRARAALEAELEFDARAYGDFPAPLAERVLERVNGLAVRMAELKRRDVKPTVVETRFSWPIEPVTVTSLFGRRLHPILKTWKAHFGIDLDASQGQLVSAAGRGVVVRAGWNGAHGQQVEIQHPGGVRTRYSHLSELLVEPGTQVDRGDPIGLAGTTGLSTGSHLHFEFWRDGEPCDPLEELSDNGLAGATTGSASAPWPAGTRRSSWP